jgi:putative redox protein
MVTITTRYEGDLHCTAIHGPSARTMETDAPVDNQGRGESFSPTDLVATALGTCMLTIMAAKAESMGIDVTGAEARVEKVMVADPQRRIGRLVVDIDVPGDISEQDRKRLEAAALACPVHKSINPAIETPIRFNWGVNGRAA